MKLMLYVLAAVDRQSTVDGRQFYESVALSTE